jgi:hypothetical protein
MVVDSDFPYHNLHRALLPENVLFLFSTTLIIKHCRAADERDLALGGISWVGLVALENGGLSEALAFHAHLVHIWRRC